MSPFRQFKETTGDEITINSDHIVSIGSYVTGEVQLVLASGKTLHVEGDYNPVVKYIVDGEL